MICYRMGTINLIITNISNHFSNQLGTIKSIPIILNMHHFIANLNFKMLTPNLCFIFVTVC